MAWLFKVETKAQRLSDPDFDRALRTATALVRRVGDGAELLTVDAFLNGVRSLKGVKVRRNFENPIFGGRLDLNGCFDVVIGDTDPEARHEIIPLGVHRDERQCLSIALCELVYYAAHPEELEGRRLHYPVVDAEGLKITERAGPYPTPVEFALNFHSPRRAAGADYGDFPFPYPSQPPMISAGTLLVMAIALEIFDRDQRVVSYRPLHNAPAWDGEFHDFAGPFEMVNQLALVLEHGPRPSTVPLGGAYPEEAGILRIPGTTASFFVRTTNYEGQTSDFGSMHDFEWLAARFPALVTQMIETPQWLPSSHALSANYGGRTFDTELRVAKNQTQAMRGDASLLVDLISRTVTHTHGRRNPLKSSPRFRGASEYLPRFENPFTFLPAEPGALTERASFLVRTANPMALANHCTALACSALEILSNAPPAYVRQPAELQILATRLLGESTAFIERSCQLAGIQRVPIADLVRQQVWAGPFAYAAGVASLDRDPAPGVGWMSANNPGHHIARSAAIRDGRASGREGYPGISQ